MTYTHSIFRAALVTLLSGIGALHAQDSAVLDTQQGIWRLYYQDPETEQWVNKSYVQQNAIAPSISSALRWTGQQFRYEYQVTNRSTAKQAIDTVRIWGIPLVYAVPDLQPITIDAKKDPEGENRQQWTQIFARRKFEATVVQAPTGWDAGLRVDTAAKQTSFVWTPGLKEADPSGIPVGASQTGYSVLRPELPGVARAKLTGSTEEPWGLDNLPDTPFWNKKIDEIQNLDYVLVPVLAPVIAIPQPYSGAELARRLKAHVQTWPKYGHASTDVLDRLNRHFDVLIPALEAANKPVARAAAVAMAKDVYALQPTLTPWKVAVDDANQASVAVQQPPVMAASKLDRVAARVLAFDMVYVMTRMELGN